MSEEREFACDGHLFGFDCNCRIREKPEEGEWGGLVRIVAVLPQDHELPDDEFELPGAVAQVLDTPRQKVDLCICCAGKLLAGACCHGVEPGEDDPTLTIPAVSDREASAATGGKQPRSEEADR